MEISGHKTEAVYRRYDIISRQDLATAATKMEHYLGTPKAAQQETVAAEDRKLLM